MLWFILCFCWYQSMGFIEFNQECIFCKAIIYCLRKNSKWNESLSISVFEIYLIEFVITQTLTLENMNKRKCKNKQFDMKNIPIRSVTQLSLIDFVSVARRLMSRWNASGTSAQNQTQLYIYKNETRDASCESVTVLFIFVCMRFLLLIHQNLLVLTVTSKVSVLLVHFVLKE